MQFLVNGLVDAKTGQVVAAFEKLKRTLPYWISQPAGTPLFLVSYVPVPSADKVFYTPPRAGCLFLVEHGTEDYHKFVMAQKNIHHLFRSNQIIASRD